MSRLLIIIVVLISILSCSKNESAKSFLIHSNWTFSNEKDSVFYKAFSVSKFCKPLLKASVITETE